MPGADWSTWNLRPGGSSEACLPGDGGEVPMARPVALQRNPSGELMDMTVSPRDEGERVLSDWLMIPVESYGPKRGYLYAGERRTMKLDWSEGDSTVRTRVVVTDGGIESKIKIMGRIHAPVVGARLRRKRLIAIVTGGGPPEKVAH